MKIKIDYSTNVKDCHNSGYIITVEHQCLQIVMEYCTQICIC